MPTAAELNTPQGFCRWLQKGLTLRNWDERIRLLVDVYGDLDQWDDQQACRWLMETGKRPCVMKVGSRFGWQSIGCGSIWMEHSLKASFVYRIDRINKMGTTRKLNRQLSGFLDAWKQGGRPAGSDVKSLSKLLIDELTWENWFSTLSALVTYGFGTNYPWKRESCHWLWREQKRPFRSELTGTTYSWPWPRELSLPRPMVDRIDQINGTLTTPKIQPQLTAFMQAWKEGVRP